MPPRVIESACDSNDDVQAEEIHDGDAADDEWATGSDAFRAGAIKRAPPLALSKEPLLLDMQQMSSKESETQ
eukprot:3416484-Karenia_brevis.AAC.1